MATVAQRTPSISGEHKFFAIASWLLGILTIGGFGLNALMGRSSFNVPLVYHLHAIIFMSFVALYVAQATLAARGNIALHMRLGQVSVILIPLMLFAGVWLTFETLRILGGPPFFGQSEFLIVNIFHLAGFGGLAFAALRMRKRPDWHKRLMFGAMATVSAPGIARLLPLPFMVPWVFPILFAVVALFPLAGMLTDRSVHGRIHPAWWWAILVPFAGLALGEAIGATDWARDWVAGFVDGTTGGERPAHAFLPKGL